MNRPSASAPAAPAGRDSLAVEPARAILLAAVAAGLLLSLVACSPTQPRTGTKQVAQTDAAAARNHAVACLPSQLAFSLDAADGRFNGMSHADTLLLLRNAGATACTVPAHPLLTFADAHQRALAINVQLPPGTVYPSTAAVTLAAEVAATSEMRWVSSDVYDNAYCATPARITLTLDQQKISTAFAGRLRGASDKPPTYTLTPFRLSEISATTTATNSKTYVCDDGRRVQAAYLNRDTALLRIHGEVIRLHIAISADGARYVGDDWQWWTKGMHDALLPLLKPMETIASESGTSCQAH